MSTSAKRPLRHITRCDYLRTRGWWVRFFRTIDGGRRCVASKLFSDRVWGGKRWALEQAKRWRNMTERTVPKPQRRSDAKPVGHGYVRRCLLKHRSGQRHPAVVAWIKLCDGPASTSYSVTRWGDRHARRKAEQWLREQRRELRQRAA
jgi:hypothetical protein